MDPALAAALDDRYRLERPLGAGGMATVYLAEDRRHGRKVALKTLRPELGASLSQERFLREITVTAGLRHPHILPLYDSGQAAGVTYYVMPVVEGESLRDRLARDGALPVDEALHLIGQVADALAHAHDKGVIHRDLKPDNILVEGGNAFVADFGIAHAVASAGDDRLTMTGLSLGTPHYMSPEQGSGDPVDARSDLYALGCVLYEMLAGTPPFSGPTAMAILARHALDPVPALRTLRPGVPAHVAEAIERALAKAPADRYASVRAWREALQRAPAAGDAAPRAVHRAAPVPTTPLLGREGTLADAEARLAEGARVLTVSGYGGTGKTRFAIELMRRVAGRFGGGAAFVSLASVTSADDVMPTVAAALDLAEVHGRTTTETLATVVGDRAVLLVLDNMEQVLGAAGEVADLVARCPRLQVVATSRAPLKIGAEVEFPLPPLELPSREAATPEAIAGAAAVALFVQRAAKVKPGFALTDANAAAVAGICRQLDGLPLALELAAARVRILEPAALLQRLDHALDLLTSGDRDLPLRQRTLRATISWSYSLLEPSEQALLRKLSVFQEGWNFEAAEQVCYDDDGRWRALDELDSLVEKGLVRAAGDRFTLLETVRAFAAEQLHAAGEVALARRGHVRWAIALGERIHADIHGDAQVPAMERARVEMPNLLAALQWVSAWAKGGDDDALEMALVLAGVLNWPWHITGAHLTARALLDPLLAQAVGRPPSRGRALARCASGMVACVTADVARGLAEGEGARDDAQAIGDAPLLGEAMIMVGYPHFLSGQMPEARAAFEEALAVAQRCGAAFVRDVARTFLGLLQFATGDLAAGKALIEEALATTLARGDAEIGGVAMSFLAQMTFASGDYGQATARYVEAEALLTRVGDWPEVARVQSETGWVKLAADDIAGARGEFRRAVRAYDVLGSARGTGHALLGLAAVEAAAGQRELAVELAAASSVLAERAGVVIEHPMDPGVVGRIEALKATIPVAQLEAIQRQVRALSTAEVVARVGG
jgi:non-specific serine/threonine protein kinase